LAAACLNESAFKTVSPNFIPGEDCVSIACEESKSIINILYRQGRVKALYSRHKLFVTEKLFAFEA
jgi:hypothetical protein